jgi:hypothetical protein
MFISVVVRPTCQNLPISRHLTTDVTLLPNEFLRAIIHLRHNALRSASKIHRLQGRSRQESFLHLKVSLLEISHRLRVVHLRHLHLHEAAVFLAQEAVQKEVVAIVEEEEVVNIIGIQ